MADTSLRVLVVGGGLAGLAMAHKFATDRTWRAKGVDITVIERRARYGGRVKTMRPRAGAWYEAGASRIGDTHTRVLTLARTLGCQTIELPASYDQRHTLPAVHRAFAKSHDAFVKKHGTDALRTVTFYDVLTMTNPRATRDDLVRRWGFLSVLVEMNAHDFWQHAMPQYLCKTYYTLQNGLQSLPDALVQRLHTDTHVRVLPSTRVLRVEAVPHRAQLRVVWQGDAAASALVAPATPATRSATRSTTFNIVVLALPAEAVAELHGVTARYAHLWRAVSRNRLIRIYAQYPKDTTSNTPIDTPTAARASSRATARKNASQTSRHTRRRNDHDLCRSVVRSSVLCKCTTTHAPEWRQLAYCDHRHADHLSNVLRLPKGVPAFRETVNRTLGAQWGEFRDKDLDVHYWKRGTHSWKPELTSDAHVPRCVQPDAKLPLFVCGASFSHYQHWMEGALETTDLAYKRCKRWAVEWLGVGGKRRTRAAEPPNAFTLHNACAHANTQHTMKDVRANKWVVLDGYVYDVQPLVHKHPGGAKLLENVLGTDISETYHRIGHSATARAWVERCCVGRLRT